MARDDVAVIVLCGAGRAFCAGNDLEASDEETAGGISKFALEEHAHDLQEVTRRVCMGEKIVIGAIHGWAVGAGFEWALNCDLTVWEEPAQAFMPEIGLGVFPTGGATKLLVDAIGKTRATEMFLFGDRIGARELADLGIANRVVKEGQALAEALVLARRVLDLPQSNVARLKRVLLRSQSLNLEDTLCLEARALVAAVMSAEKSDD
jgi:enoyl-CoA hydratase/carnithine racemase